MEVKSCRRCKKLFNYISGQAICPACKEELESKFQDVKKYLDEHKGASIMQISEDCEVEEHVIRQWIREERLEFSSGLSGEITCETCGAPITTGRYCDKCKASVLNGLIDAGRKPEPHNLQSTQSKESVNRNKMRFLNSNR